MITVIDYGLGNIRSVMRALAHENVEAKLSSDPHEILSASRVILPGVGAFADGMAGLKERNLIDPLLRYIDSGKPFLGICLGMQMLFDSAEEFGHHQGLGLVSGRVSRIPNSDLNGDPIKVPHMGWSPLLLPSGKESWKNSILDGIKESSSVYFVHSYAGNPKNQKDRLANTSYGGNLILAAIQKTNIFGCQFHPEKSGPIGLQILRNFLVETRV
jgi:glutamine amidotransferase